jgi:hypothetical protein
MSGRPPTEEQLRAFRDTLARNKVLTETLARAVVLDLPGWYVGASCPTRTVWNVVTGRAPTHGISDYDLIYFDAADLSRDAESVRWRHFLPATWAVRACLTGREPLKCHRQPAGASGRCWRRVRGRSSRRSRDHLRRRAGPDENAHSPPFVRGD